MKNITRIILLLFTTSIFAQDLFFEQSTSSSSTFGQIDTYQFNGVLRDNTMYNTSFNKTEGWSLVAVDDTNYYYQITDENSANYGQIDIWNSKLETRTTYGNLSSIFSDPTNWTLGGADNGILYFSSGVINSEIVSWDGTTLNTFAYLNEVVVSPQFWRLAGFHNGVMYIEWTNPSNFAPSIKTWDGSSSQGTYDNTNFYTNYDDAFLFGVSDYTIGSNSLLLSELEKVKNHVLGTNTLTETELEVLKTTIEQDNTLFESDLDVMKLGFAIIASSEAINGALFTTGTKSLGGYSRTASGYEFENVILAIMQSILDYSYTETNITTHPELFNNTFFKTAAFFPGSVDQPTNPSENHTIQVNGTHVRKWGTQANYETEDARRPTGCYLAPGSIAKITVPSSLVGIGASVLVGAHTWDLSIKPDIKRMDRIYKTYEINSETISVANPLGGGIYINVPYENDLGILDITLQNVVRSPFYSNTVANKTSLSDWQNVERLRTAPWTDFETEKMMIQVPTSWIYAYDDPETAMNDWDLSLDAVSTLLGRPEIRSKTVLYEQVDVIPRGFANFPGYPQSNVSYDSYADFDGDHDHYLLNGPRNERGYLITTLFHELGHAEKIYKFSGEIESFVNFLWVAIYNKAFGVELNTAFSESFWGVNHTIDEAAISWMITQNFREGNQMSTTTGEFRQEFSYQLRGHAKYADIVRLFGWEALEKFYYDTSVSYDNGEIDYSNNVNNAPTDSRVLRMSEAAGYDMRPLIHFWGIQPNDFESLSASIEASAVKKSTAIYDQLMFYKTIVPMDNETFRNFGLEDYTESGILNSQPFDHVSQSYYEGFFNTWWNSYDQNEGQAAVNQIQAVIDLYFPEGRPEEDNNSCTEIAPTSVEASSHHTTFTAENTLDGNPGTRWAANSNNVSLIYDLGEVYDLCDLDIDFQNGLSRLDYFDIEVSRDNKTYAAVMQNLTNSKTTDSYDTYSVSRQARYLKITCRGNENDNWNSIQDVKFYVSPSETLTVNENNIDNLNIISVFPNPAKNVLNISDSIQEKTNANIYGLDGSLIQSDIIDLETTSIDVSRLSNGVYFIQVETDNTISINKFVISK